MNIIKKIILALTILSINNGFAYNTPSTYAQKPNFSLNINVYDSKQLAVELNTKQQHFSFDSTQINIIQQELQANPNLAEDLTLQFQRYLIEIYYKTPGALKLLRSLNDVSKRFIILLCDFSKSVIQDDIIFSIADPKNNVVAVLDTIIKTIKKDLPVPTIGSSIKLARDGRSLVGRIAEKDSILYKKLEAFMFQSLIVSGLSDNDLNELKNPLTKNIIIPTFIVNFDRLIGYIENTVSQPETKSLVRTFGSQIKKFLQHLQKQID
jgi:hypothetical protein